MMMNKRRKLNNFSPLFSSLYWRSGELASTRNINLPEDIWFEIFVLLPLNLIFKFKCVSKEWFSLLSNPNFISKWMKHNSSSKSVPWSVAYTNLSFKHDWATNPSPKVFSPSIASLGAQSKFKFNKEIYEKLHAVGSSNGLVLFSLSQFNQNQITYVVCNPLTQKLVFLPPPPQDVVPDCPTMTGFVCEYFPSTSYKVVRIPKFGEEKRMFNIHIFSSDSSEWKICEVSCPEAISWSVLWSNGLVSHNGDLLLIATSTNRILAYNIYKNKCRMIELPADQVRGDDPSSSQCLTVSEGLLCYARKIYLSLSVWVLKENWQLLHKDIKLRDHILARNKFLGVLSDILESRIVSRVRGFNLVDNKNLSDILTKHMWHSHVLGFNPLDKNVVLLGICNCVLAFNIQTKKLEELSVGRRRNVFQFIFRAVVLELWPTELPALSIINNHIA